jgi:hypothetical protein
MAGHEWAAGPPVSYQSLQPWIDVASTEAGGAGTPTGRHRRWTDSLGATPTITEWVEPARDQAGSALGPEVAVQVEPADRAASAPARVATEPGQGLVGEQVADRGRAEQDGQRPRGDPPSG